MPASSETIKQDLDQLTAEQLQQVADFVTALKAQHYPAADIEVAPVEAQEPGFQPLPQLAVELPKAELVDWCDRWKVRELYLFGSVLRDDFRPEESDIDVMVTFDPDAHWGWSFLTMKQELVKLLGRKVDLLTKRSIEKSENWIRRNKILETARLIYVAG